MEQGASGVIDWHWTIMGTVPTSIDKEKDILAEGGSEGLRKKKENPCSQGRSISEGIWDN